MNHIAVGAAGVVWLLSGCRASESWTLPRDRAVKSSGPRTYRVTVDHTVSDTKGQIVQRQRVSGDYTRGLPGGDAVWNNVTVAESIGPAEISGPGRKRDFMEGFRHRAGSAGLGETMKPAFFKGFPPTAVFERNLVWDTGMIEMFGQDQFAHLRLNAPYRVISAQDVKMPGMGVFHNRDVALTWVGRSRRNGQECAVIEYRAYFNPLRIANGGMTLTGRSHYWGEIWVSLATRQIEYATLQEDVLGEMKLAGQETRIINVFRSGVFEPVTRKESSGREAR
jgi:hypothetical protein